MNVLILVEAGVNSQHICMASYAGDRDMRALLHHVAERACQLDFACAFHNSNLDRQKLSADRRPRQAVNNADFVLLAIGVGQVLFVAQKRLNSLVVNLKDFLAVLELFNRALAHYGSDIAL